MRVVVRPATLDDLDWVMGQAVAFDKFFDAKFSLVPSPAAAAKLFEFLIDEHLFLISEVSGEPTGFISGLVTPHILNNDVITLTELLWWVDPRYRQGRSGLSLLNEFIDWGKANADLINFSLEDKSPIKDATLERRGFRYKERAFIMECV